MKSWVVLSLGEPGRVPESPGRALGGRLLSSQTTQMSWLRYVADTVAGVNGFYTT